MLLDRGPDRPRLSHQPSQSCFYLEGGAGRNDRARGDSEHTLSPAPTAARARLPGSPTGIYAGAARLILRRHTRIGPLNRWTSTSTTPRAATRSPSTPLDPEARHHVRLRTHGLWPRAHRQRPSGRGLRRAVPGSCRVLYPRGGLRPQRHGHRRQDQSARPRSNGEDIATLANRFTEAYQQDVIAALGNLDPD